MEDTILGLCLHISCQHGYTGLIWFCDINEFTRVHVDNIDWELLLERCGEHRVRKAVYYALLFTVQLFDAPVPERVLKTLSGARGRLDGAVLKAIRRANSSMDYLAELFMFDSLRDTARYVGGGIIAYPGMAGHFSRVLVKVVRQLVSRPEASEDSGTQV
ncbi:MAG: hypothetical protein GF392_03805 [Candidatus Omnitrophica bacterium]|nr:hypothetical protein [Candidatus Omnitrophota bacterium]